MSGRGNGWMAGWVGGKVHRGKVDGKNDRWEVKGRTEEPTLTTTLSRLAYKILHLWQPT